MMMKFLIKYPHQNRFSSNLLTLPQFSKAISKKKKKKLACNPNEATEMQQLDLLLDATN